MAHGFQQWPIWNIINSCAYADKRGSSMGNKSYGIQEHGEVEVRVGTSKRNSHKFLETKLTHRRIDENTQSFRFYVNGEVLKEAILKKGSDELEWVKA